MGLSTAPALPIYLETETRHINVRPVTNNLHQPSRQLDLKVLHQITLDAQVTRFTDIKTQFEQMLVGNKCNSDEKTARNTHAKKADITCAPPRRREMSPAVLFRLQLSRLGNVNWVLLLTFVTLSHREAEDIRQAQGLLMPDRESAGMMGTAPLNSPSVTLAYGEKTCYFSRFSKEDS